jgi:2-polyprenyl-3-methyl-5-hydroxy-6-metoxy-1,4-benzoquinol methylase
LKIVESLTTYFFSCSNFISNQFTPTKKALFNVVEPHNFSLPSTQRDLNLNQDYVIQVIGTQSFRKNHNFAITLSKSLALRGFNVRLDIIGTENNATSQINQLIRRRQINCRLIAHTPRPFDLNLSSNVITLVSSTSEPYGLTIPESLRHGIPVIASRSGGPIELLPDDYLFDTDDLHSAGLIIERIFRNYSLHVNRSIELYNLMQSRNQKIQLQKSIDDTLTKAIVDFKSNNESFLWNLLRKINTLNNFPLSIESVAQSITEIRDIHSPFDNSEFVADLIVHEQKYPGSAVLRDVMNYDVIPFAKSTCMDHLYKHGIGLSVELASTYIDNDRIQMLAFIICALLEKQNDTKTPLKVLALGDGIGIDSIRLALVDFEVDYLDYETSNMSRIADLNIQKAKKLNNSLTISVIQELSHGYDAIVCLEVIEHVAEPKAFTDYIHTHLKEDGLLFISECFNGIEDRWPTHLFSSEKYSALLPFMMASNFSLLRYNKSPLFKPYVYTKRSGAVDSEIMSLFSDRSILQSLISNKSNLGV